MTCNPRFSEDLDFVVGHTHLRAPLTEPILPFNAVLAHTRTLLPWIPEMSFRIQKATSTLQRVVTTATLPDNTRTRLHLEFVAVPSYSATLVTLPWDIQSFELAVESRREILADKVVARQGCGLSSPTLY